MQLPEQVKVGPIVYQVQLDQQLLGKQLYGSIRFLEGVIAIAPDLPPMLAQVKVWHELCHAILAQGGFDEHDERMIDVLSYGIVQILADNPRLIG